jgi:hypothetical protein
VQGPLPESRRLSRVRPARRRFVGGLLASFFAAVASSAFAQNDLTRTVGVTVGESTSATVRMLKLTKGTRLAFAVQGEQPLAIVVLDEANFNKFPQQGASPLIAGRAAPALSFGVQLPADGNYFLVLDNRENAAPNKVRIQLRATLPAGAKKADEPRPEVQQY